jgi:hypothetical protein
MSNQVSVLIVEDQANGKRIALRMETQAGDLAASLIITAVDARGIAQGLIDAAKVCERKIITGEPLPHFTLHKPADGEN